MAKRMVTVKVPVKVLKRLLAYLKALTTKSRSYALGWDTILDRTENAVSRARLWMLFRREIGTINRLRREYEGYMMPHYTSVMPANLIIVRIERKLGLRPRMRWRPRRRR